MPPYEQDRIIWQYTNRECTRQHVDPQNGKSWRVVVSFIRVGQHATTQERVEETVETFTIAERLGPNQALDLLTTVQGACDRSYTQGYAAARASR